VSQHVHGWLECRACFAEVSLAEKVLNVDGYRLVNDPGYWGAADPVVLVLGQSKGRTQWRAAARDFDAVAFAGIRDRLRAVLDRVGVPTGKGDFDDRFTAAETYLGFASVVRCSLSTHDGRSSPSPVAQAMRSSADRWVRMCMERWLTDLNPRLRLVILLGLTNAYVAAVISRIRALHPQTFRQENATTVHAAGVVWTFVQHPSKQAVTSFRDWIGDEPLDKRDNAVAAVHAALGTAQTTAEPRTTAMTAPPSPRRQQRTREQGASTLCAAIARYLAEHADLVRHGALITDNKKMSDWRTSNGTVFAYENETGKLWTLNLPTVRELSTVIVHTPYPASELWTTTSRDGRPRYGRHSALRSIPELRDADLIRFALSDIADATRIVTALLRA
jgi:hypothetical protein